MQLTPKLEARIEELMESGDYSDRDAVVADALLLLEERTSRLDELRRLLAEGEEDEINGNVFELTPELWDEIRQTARHRAELSRDLVRP